MRKWIAAVLIAGAAVLIDFLFHYVFLPETSGGTVVAFHESPLYFYAKLAIFFVVAWLFLLLGLMIRPVGRWGSFSTASGPIIFGVVAAAAFGLFYYTYPAASVGTGSMPLFLKAAWGGIHAGAAMIPAGVYTRKWLAVYVGIALLVVSGVALAVFGPALAAASPPGY